MEDGCTRFLQRIGDLFRFGKSFVGFVTFFLRRRIVGLGKMDNDI
jgi:hypothetical protein